MSDKRIAFVLPTALPARVFLEHQLKALALQGYRIHVYCNTSAKQVNLFNDPGIHVFHIPISREIEPHRDILVLLTLIREFIRFRPLIVNASTPKAGLLGTLAAWIARVPIRIFLIRGLRAETLRGTKRFLVIAMEKLAAWCASEVVCVGPGLATAVEHIGIVKRAQITVVGNGPDYGVDLSKYVAPDQTAETRARILKAAGWPEDSFVLGFVGRLVHDKGINELCEIFAKLSAEYQNLRLLLVGDFESGDPVDSRNRKLMENSPLIRISGHVDSPHSFFSAMDILVFPTHREGFPFVPIEAAAAQVPTVGFSATGMGDAVLHGQTGLLVPVGDNHGMERCIRRLVLDKTYRKSLGHCAYQRAVLSFSASVASENWLHFYQQRLDEKMF